MSKSYPNYPGRNDLGFSCSMDLYTHMYLFYMKLLIIIFSFLGIHNVGLPQQMDMAGIANRHNLEIAYDETLNSYIPIPYDFDYAGIVNQPYAIPNKGLGIRKVTQPLFLMKGVKKDELRSMVEFYIQKRPALNEVINSVPFLSENSMDEMLRRINDLYEVLENESQ